MALTYKSSKIISNEEIATGIYKMVVEEDQEINAGQFYMLKLAGSSTLLPRPISICSKDGNTITFLYAVVGKGTEEFSKLKKDDEINITGPIGNGFDINKDYGKKIALVSGGIGTAPMFETAKKLRENNKNAQIDLYAGFRDEVYLVNEFEKYADNINITTNTGSHGHKGFVTDILKPEEYDVVLCCGPEIMMKKVIEMCREKGTKIYVSMEKHMGCGVGACLVCTCKTKNGNKRTCVDGPVFDGYEVEL